MPLNVKLLRRVQKKILAEPNHFNMEYWHEQTDICGTERCIAGWAIALENKLALNTNVELVVPPDGFFDMTGADALGIDWLAAQDLFYSERWPFDFRSKYNAAANAHRHDRMALWASKMIDHFIKAHEDK